MNNDRNVLLLVMIIAVLSTLLFIRLLVWLTMRCDDPSFRYRWIARPKNRIKLALNPSNWVMPLPIRRILLALESAYRRLIEWLTLVVIVVFYLLALAIGWCIVIIVALFTWRFLSSIYH